ncbi:MAG: hypothetical protein ACRDH9_01865 [Actinomycetota bacterium]
MSGATIKRWSALPVMGAALLLWTASVAAGAPAETSITSLAATVETGRVSVSGAAEFAGPIAVIGTDGAGDATVPDVGADLTSASLSTSYDSSGGMVTLRLAVADAPDDEAGEPPQGVHYTWGFTAREGAGAEREYQVSIVRRAVVANPGTTGPAFRLSTCTASPVFVCVMVTALTGTIGREEVTVDVPLQHLEGKPGTELTTKQLISAANVTAGPVSRFGAALDAVTVPPSPYAVPQPNVLLGMGEVGSSVPLTRYAVVDTAGTFAGSLPTDGHASGEKLIAARACLGGVCADASTMVTL